MNDVENIPLGLFVLWGATLISYEKTAQIVIILSIIVFTLSRIIFSFFFANKIQPWRTISYAAAHVGTLAAAITGIVEGFNKL